METKGDGWSIIKDLTANQIVFIQDNLRRYPRDIIQDKFREEFKCRIELKHVDAVARRYDYKITPLSPRVNNLIDKYYGKLSNKAIVELLNYKFNLGWDVKRLSRYCEKVLNKPCSSAKSKTWYELIDMDTRECILEGTIDSISKKLCLDFDCVYRHAKRDYPLRIAGSKYRLKEIDIYEH